MTIALVLAASMVETARPAKAFVDSIGVVTHLAYWDTPYGKRFDDVSQRLQQLGVKHIRDGVVLGQTLVCRRERTLAARGIRFSYVTQPTLTAADLAAWAACAGPAIEGFEGPNEYDISHPAADGAWAQTIATFQRTLYGAVHSNAAMRGLSVIGPSLTSGDAFRAVGDLSPWMDYGNMHDYFGGHEPGTDGWGIGGYGSIQYNLSAARPVSATRPIVATESGYGTRDAAGDVAEEVQAAYVPRLFLDHFIAGVVRTDEYELLDEGPDPYSHYGLLRGDLTPKPAFTAMQSLIAVFKDDGRKERSDRLAFSIDGGNAIRHALFEKSNGTFLLAIWIERPTVDPSTRLRLPLPTQPVTLKVASKDAVLQAFAFDREDRLQSAQPVNQEIRVALDDRVTIVQIREQAKPLR